MPATSCSPRAASSSSRTRGSSRRCAPSRTRPSSTRSAAPPRPRTRRIARFAEEPFVGRTERELAWRMESLLHEARRRGARRSRRSSPPARTADRRTRCPGDRRIERGGDDRGRRGLPYRRLLLRLHAHVRSPASCRTTSRRAYDVVRRAQEAGLAAVRAGADSAAVDAHRPRRDRGRGPRRRVRPRSRPRRRARRPRAAVAERRVAEHARRRQRRHRRAGRLPPRPRRRADRGSGRSSPTTAPRCSPPSPRSS